MRLAVGSRLAVKLAWRIGLGSASFVLSVLGSCSWNDVFPTHSTTLPNTEAVDRALELCSLSAGDQPFHLVLSIDPPAEALTPAQFQMQAQIEVFWLNPITYRTVIRSREFTQTRIVNGRVVEEHNTGDFYPRWIQNFVDALLEPIPKASLLRKIPGSVPIGVQAHACIADDAALAQVCFQDVEPRIATGSDSSRSIWFENYAPFGHQQIARTLADKLPGNLLLRGHIVQLAPLSQSDYPLIKAMEFTLPAKLIQTDLVSQSAAETLLQIPPPEFQNKAPAASGRSRQQRPASTTAARSTGAPEGPTTVLIRTDSTGKVREAYADGGAPHGTVARVMALRFKPLFVDGIPHQMEASIAVP